MPFPKLFRSRADGHVIYARTTTAGDVDAGRAGAKGDFLALRDRHNAQWFTKASFLEQYEEIDNAAADELSTDPETALAILDGQAEREPEAAPAPAELSSGDMIRRDGTPVDVALLEQLEELRAMFWRAREFPAGAIAGGHAAELEQLAGRLDAIDDAGSKLAARVELLELAAADPATRATDATPAAAADDDSSSSSSSAKGHSKRR